MKIIFEKYRLPISIALWLFLSLLVLFLWIKHQEQVQKADRNKVEDTGRLLAQQIQQAVDGDINRLNNLKSRLEVTNGDYFDYWYFDAGQIIAQESSFEFIEWIDTNMVVRFIEPQEGNEAAIGLDISELDYRREDWLKTKEDSVFNLTHWLELVQGPDAFLLDVPVYYDGRFQGTITAGIDFKNQFDEVMQGLNIYHIKISDSRGNYFYQHGDSTGINNFMDMEVRKDVSIRDAGGDKWHLSIIPNTHFRDNQFVVGSYLNLGLALVLSLFVAIIFYFMQVAYEAQKKTRQANKKIRDLIDSSPLATYAIDRDGIVRDFWNQAAEQILGWRRDEVLGEFLPHVGEDRTEEFKSLMQSRQSEGNIRNKEIVRRKKNGDPVNLRLNVGSIVGEESEEQLMLVTLEDTTRETEYKQKLENSIHEKEVLLSEIHHRVKNNLAIIAGLIELQKGDLEDPELIKILKGTQNRIYSIAGVHELLYNTESFSEISFEDYAKNLIDKIRKMYSSVDKDIEFEYEFKSLTLNINQAIPLGLMLNELISNSIKHAFSGQEKGIIQIYLTEAGDTLNLLYKDNGKGMEIDEFEESKTLGLTLIRTLLAQLDAEYTINNERGFHFSIVFAKKDRGAHSNYEEG